MAFKELYAFPEPDEIFVLSGRTDGPLLRFCVCAAEWRMYLQLGTNPKYFPQTDDPLRCRLVQIAPDLLPKVLADRALKIVNVKYKH